MFSITFYPYAAFRVISWKYSYITYLLLCNKLPTHLAAGSSKHVLLHSFWGTGIQEWLSWVVLAQCLSQGEGQVRRVGAGPERKLLPGWLTSIPPHRAAWVVSGQSSWLPQAEVWGEAAAGSHSFLYDPVPESHTFSSALFSFLEANQEGWSTLKGRRMKLHLLKRRLSKNSKHLKITTQGFPGSPVVKNPHLHCRRQRFHPWMGK